MMDMPSLAENVQEISTLIPASMAGGAGSGISDGPAHERRPPRTHMTTGRCVTGRREERKGTPCQTKHPCAEAACQNGAALGAGHKTRVTDLTTGRLDYAARASTEVLHKKQARRSELGGILLPNTIRMAGVRCRPLESGPELQIRLAGCIHHHQ
mgnify:CR=1 FL=1